MREGEAIRDFIYPDRIVVGSNDNKSQKILKNLYSPLISKGAKFISTKRRAAELIKYASNAFLATKITFINEIANLCEKTDVDINFNIVDGKVGNHVARSAIAMKADHIRILANEGIKLVTSAHLINSQGGDIGQSLGVDIIAGNNDSDLQPMLLGNNVADALVSLAAVVSSLAGISQDIVNDLIQLEASLAAHSHPSPFFGLPTLPAPMLTMSCTQQMIKLISVNTFSTFANKYNLNNFFFKYITPGAPKHIRSYYNNVN